MLQGRQGFLKVKTLILHSMEDHSVRRFIPEHPLPKEIQEMKRDDTVCQFCGVSYLIHNEMKALEMRVKEVEKQLEYYKGSVKREEQLKVKVASMEEESDKLSRALQASEQRTSILDADLISKQDQIEELKRKNNDLKIDKQNDLSQLRDHVKFLSRSQRDLQIQRTGLKDLKLFVEEKNEAFSEQITNLSTDVALFCMKFLEEKHKLVEKLTRCKTGKAFAEEALQKSDVSLQELSSKCMLLESKVSEQDKELKRVKEQNDLYNKEIQCYKELTKSKSSDLNNCKEKLQTQTEVFQQEITLKEDKLLSKESQIRELTENCQNLEKRIAEFTNDRNSEEEKKLNRAAEMEALKESLTKANDEVAALKLEREMMIAAHHNRIEQLRESFKKKMEEADAWPSKLEKIMNEKEAQFLEEKSNLWKELTDGFQKEMDEEQQKHIDDLAAWRKEAKAAQDKFREDITSLNRKHREEIKQLERAATEAQGETEQTRNASKSIIQNLEAKILDLEHRTRQPSVESVEHVARLTTKLQESDKSLQQAEKRIIELEAKKEAWIEEVIGHLYLLRTTK
ncbi:uncharacterized protein [Acropora muricata]|uniref:uncharacterized protein isoform X3 n=1 Tax=Acropora muricata TaxID=159855 RepID=UPI0034E571E0